MHCAQANLRLLATCYFRADQLHRAYDVLTGTHIAPTSVTKHSDIHMHAYLSTLEVLRAPFRTSQWAGGSTWHEALETDTEELLQNIEK